MSPFDVFDDDMRAIARADEQAFDLLLAGRLDRGGPSVEREAAFLGRLAQTVPIPSVAHLENDHVAAMMAAAGEHTVVEAPAATVAEPRPLFAGLRLKAAAAGATLVSAFGGMAYAGVLPEPLQERAARLAEAVGIEIPGGADQTAAGDADPVRDRDGAFREAEDRSRWDSSDDGRGERAAKARDDDGPAGSKSAHAGGPTGDDDADHQEGSAERDEDAADRQEDEAEEQADRDEDGRDEDEDRAEETVDETDEAADDTTDAEEEAADDGADADEETSDDADAGEGD